MSKSAFVVHQRADAQFVQRLALALRALGGWRLNDAIPVVAGWATLARQAICAADAVVIVATPASLSSESCRFEWEYAVSRDQRLIRVDIDARVAGLLPEELCRYPSVVFEGDVLSLACALRRLMTSAVSEPNVLSPEYKGTSCKYF